MAGEFYVMTSLYRLGHQPALTLGNAKSIDILVRHRSGRLLEISVKAIRGGGKWGVGTEDFGSRPNLFFVLLHFLSFADPKHAPRAWVLPAADVARIRKPWFQSQAVFTYKSLLHELTPFEDAWHLLDRVEA